MAIGLLAWLNGQVNSSVSVAPLRYLALMGSQAEMITVTTPFVNAGQIKLLRQYAAPARFLAEAPLDYLGGNFPPDLAVSLYEIVLPTEAAFIRQEVINAAIGHPVVVNDDGDDLGWLSFLPGQVMVSGECLGIDQTMNGVSGLGVPQIVDFDNTGVCEDNQQIRLYPILNGEQVLSKTAEINLITSTVTAEPNYLTVGSPDEGSISGSPGGPYVPNAPPTFPVAQPFDGADVRVVVFDTVPFLLTVGGSYSQTFQDVTLTAFYPFSLPLDLPISDHYAPAHGTFVASGAMVLAPQAQFQLVKVMNEWAVGDSFTLYQAMITAVSDLQMAQNSLRGAVFNYSLTLEAPISATVTTMETMLAWIDQQGIAQIAAAGNDSAYVATPKAMPYPARHSAVVGVTAVSANNTIACYANAGEVAVWGGGTPRDPETPCHVVDMAVACDAQTCVVGWDPASSTQYAYGFGTSFAAPLATGFAAQAIGGLSPAVGEWPALSCVRQNLYNFAAQQSYGETAVIQHGILSNPYSPSFTPYPFAPCPPAIFLPIVRDS